MDVFCVCIYIHFVTSYALPIIIIDLTLDGYRFRTMILNWISRSLVNDIINSRQDVGALCRGSIVNLLPKY